MKRIALTVVLPLLARCGADAAAPIADRIEVVSGADQVGGSGAPLSEPIVVRLVGRAGSPLGAASVEWRVIEGGGTITDAQTTTDADGLASAAWQLGLSAGRNLLLVATPGATLTVRAMGEGWLGGVSAGTRHTCALTTTGEAYCWGSNATSQLGDGTRTNRSTPVRVNTPVRFRSLSAGWSHTCGIAADGDTYCWGSNTEGQLGSGLSTDAPTPVRVAASVGFTTVSTGFVHSCAITVDGFAYCWGGNGQRQLGVDGQLRSRVPLRVAGSTTFTRISAGEFHSCAVATDQRGYCWGWNSAGELGNGSAVNTFATGPVEVSGGLRLREITAGVRHTCALGSDHAAYCWGRNGAGEVGAPAFQNQGSPLRLNTPLVFSAIGAGNVHSCGIATDPQSEAPGASAAYCWGSDGFNVFAHQPAAVFTGADVSLAVGFDHACAVQRGAVWCWGSNADGKLGTPGVAGSRTPLRVDFGAS